MVQSLIFSLRNNLRVKIAVLVALPIIIALLTVYVVHYIRERQVLDRQIDETTYKYGDLMYGSVRHAMLANDHEMLVRITSDIGGMENILRAQIIDNDGRVTVSSIPEERGRTLSKSNVGCKECHQFPPESRPRIHRLSMEPGILRVVTPIINEPECTSCHDSNSSHLGILLLDLTLVDIEEHLITDLWINLAISLTSAFGIALGAYYLIHWVVVRRIEAFRPVLEKFSTGDLTARLPNTSNTNDELNQLAVVINQMAEHLERNIREKDSIQDLRQRAIVDERERIARELHDGLAQILGYINTKTRAVRLMLENQDTLGAAKHMLQLEEASQGLFVEVREVILDLRMANQIGHGLDVSLRDLATQYRHLSNLPVDLAIDPNLENLALDAETELHLIRITQEALVNVRKHASATIARVNLQIHDGQLEIVIADNGKGFDPERLSLDKPPSFGINTMHERAEIIGASLSLKSELGVGTRVRVLLPLEEDLA